VFLRGMHLLDVEERGGCGGDEDQRYGDGQPKLTHGEASSSYIKALACIEERPAYAEASTYATASTDKPAGEVGRLLFVEALLLRYLFKRFVFDGVICDAQTGTGVQQRITYVFFQSVVECTRLNQLKKLHSLLGGSVLVFVELEQSVEPVLHPGVGFLESI